jgi:Ca2+-binding RTX toxin-like protein
LNVSTDGTSVTAVGTENNVDANDPDSQFAVTFEGQSSLNFTLTAGDSDAGFNFGNIDNGTFNITDVDNGTNGSDDGDDLITGRDGADKIFGEGGSDTIIGGNAGDVVDGGTEGSDVDVLDLRGEGPARIVNETTDADGDSTSGTVEFLDVAGNVTGSLEFTEIESVLLDPVDQTPVANDDALTIEEDSGPVTINVLGNDTDPQGQDLTITDATVPANQGTVDIVGNQLVFTPADDFNGDATIVYTIEGTDQNPATAEVLVTVNPVNDAPIATDDDATTDFETAVVISPLGNDSDPDTGDTITISDASVPANQGSVTFDPVAGTLTFTPADDFEGDATITYEITDGDLTDTAEVTVTVGLNPADGIVDGLDTGEVMNPGYVDTQGDEIDGTDGLDDVIEGNGGDDTINAGAGDDTVSGGEDDDVIDGGVGDDVLAGDEGDDSLVGGDGADELAGGADDDTLEGGLGDDALSGDEGDDVLDGGDGADTIAGGDGSDSVDGGAGDDVINSSIFGNIGTPDNGYPGVYLGDSDPTNDMDTVNGGAGNDVISTGDDADLIDGGTGNDTIYAGNDPALGLDAFNIEDDGTNPLGPDLNVTNGQDTVSGGDGNDVIFGADDDDVLSGDAGNDTIDGGIDDDSIDGGTGDDVLIGGQGDDTIGEDDINGGIGNDVLSGGADADHFSGVNAGDTVIGGETGDDNDTLNLAGSVQPGGSYVIDYTPGTDDEDGVINHFDDNGDAAGTLVFSEIETIIPCFTPGTLIATAKGERCVEDLVEGDRIITRDNGIQTIRWAGSREMTGAEFKQAAHLKPIHISKGALGDNMPTRDMVVSPNQRFLINSTLTNVLVGESEVLVAAKFLTNLAGVRPVVPSQVDYILVMFDHHEIVLANSAWAESFQPDELSLHQIGDVQRTEILMQFPDLYTAQGQRGFRSARRSLKQGEASTLDRRKSL